MKSVIGQLGATLKDDHGVVMVVVVMFSVVVVISGLAFLSLSSSGSTMLERPLNRSKALYLAEGGMRKAIWRMNRSSLDQYALSATFSDTTADGLTTVAFDTTTNILTCTGVVDGINKTLPIEVEIEYTYQNHVVSYKNYIRQIGGSGTLTYDADSAPRQVSDLPTVDIGYYQSIADVEYSGDRTFQNTSLTGIYYVDGNASVKNKTVIDGTLVVTGNITFQGQNTFTAQAVPGDPSTYYPAIITLGSMSGGDQHLHISGGVYADGDVDLDPCDLTGLIVAAGVQLQGSFSVTYDSTYSAPPPGFVWPEGFITMTISAIRGVWSEI